MKRVIILLILMFGIMGCDATTSKPKEKRSYLMEKVKDGESGDFSYYYKLEFLKFHLIEKTPTYMVYRVEYLVGRGFKHDKYPIEKQYRDYYLLESDRGITWYENKADQVTTENIPVPKSDFMKLVESIGTGG